MGIAFGGGGSQTVFGSSGAGNFLTRLTSITAVIFMVTSLVLAHNSSQQDSKRLQRLEGKKAAEQDVEKARLDKLKAEIEKAAAAKAGQSATPAPATGGCGDADAVAGNHPAEADGAEARPRRRREGHRQDGEPEGRGQAYEGSQGLEGWRSGAGREAGEAQEEGGRPPRATAARRPLRRRRRLPPPRSRIGRYRDGATVHEGRRSGQRLPRRRPASGTAGGDGALARRPRILRSCARSAIGASASAATACWRSCPSQTADARMRVLNADGSEAEMCGNGIRCVAALLLRHRSALRRPPCASRPAPACSSLQAGRRGRAGPHRGRRHGPAAADTRRDPAPSRRRRRGRCASRSRRVAATFHLTARVDGQPARGDLHRRSQPSLRPLAEEFGPLFETAERFPRPHQRRVRARAPERRDRSGRLGARQRHHAGVRHRRLRDGRRRLPGRTTVAWSANDSSICPAGR